MPSPRGWNAADAAARCAVGSWSGVVWRGHSSAFSPTDWHGSLLFSGRFNRGYDTASAEQAWPVLYLAVERAAVLAEMMRHLISDTPSRLDALLSENPNMTAKELAQACRMQVSGLNNRRMSKIYASLSTVADCLDVRALGLTLPGQEPADLFHDTDYTVGQELAAAVRARGCEAMLVPSATKFGNSLIVFPDNLTSSATIELIETTAHPFYVEK